MARIDHEKRNRQDLGYSSKTTRVWFPVVSRFDYRCETCGEKHLAGEQAFYNALREPGKKMRCRRCQS